MRFLLPCLVLVACASPQEKLARALDERDGAGVRAALAAGASATERIGRLSPLCVALEANAGAEAVEALLEAGAGIRGRCRGGSSLMSVAAAAGNVAAAQLLREAGADIDATNHLGERPLLAAACLGHRDMVGWLLDSGHPPGRNQRLDPTTPIGCAYFRGHPPVTELLEERVEVSEDPIPMPGGGGGHEGHMH
ncbi:MAG: ankyrin repeat domain-containing protein [Myxococcota bacterium]